MKAKTWSEIIEKIIQLHFEESFDLAVGIAEGGVIPASLIASFHQIPLEFIWINFRDEANLPQKPSPELLRPISFVWKGKNILLIDDRCNTGATLRLAKKSLKRVALIKTLVVNGKADYCLFDEECFRMPWTVEKFTEVRPKT